MVQLAISFALLYKTLLCPFLCGFCCWFKVLRSVVLCAELFHVWIRLTYLGEFTHINWVCTLVKSFFSLTTLFLLLTLLFQYIKILRKHCHLWCLSWYMLLLVALALRCNLYNVRIAVFVKWLFVLSASEPLLRVVLVIFFIRSFFTVC